MAAKSRKFNLVGKIPMAGPQRIIPVILSGGSGTRLWPVSRKSFPKQFWPLISKKTLLVETALRATAPEFTAPIIVTNQEHRFVVAEQLREAGDRGCEDPAGTKRPQQRPRHRRRRDAGRRNQSRCHPLDHGRRRRHRRPGSPRHSDPARRRCRRRRLFRHLRHAAHRA